MVGDAADSYVQAVLVLPAWQVLAVVLVVAALGVRWFRRSARADTLAALVDRYRRPPSAAETKAAVDAAPRRALTKAVRRLVTAGPGDPTNSVVRLVDCLDADHRGRVAEVAIAAASPWRRPALRAALDGAEEAESGGP